MLEDFFITYNFNENNFLYPNYEKHGSQTMKAPLVVLSKGFIYNKDELLHNYNLDNDVETEDLIRHGYNVNGDKFISEINGDIVFIIIDLKNRKVIACRDPLGRFNCYCPCNLS